MGFGKDQSQTPLPLHMAGQNILGAETVRAEELQWFDNIIVSGLTLDTLLSNGDIHTWLLQSKSVGNPSHTYIHLLLPEIQMYGLCGCNLISDT
jgi:hypothetical protein